MSHISSTAQNVHAEGNARVQVGNTFYFSRDPCLQALYTTDPELDKERIEYNQGGLLDDVYQWVLHNKDFQQWLSSEDGLLWIQGDPGKGKSMLLCGIINELKKDGVTLSYFFCQATDDRINSATAVLRGLLYMLIGKQPSPPRYVQERYDRIGSQLFKDANAWFALSDIFKDILNDGDLRPSYLIVDALDECLIDRGKLLDLIVSSSAQFRIKWIISSRNWPIIEKYLGQAAGKIGLRLELNEKSVSAAVAAYINIKVDWLAQRNQYNDNTKHAVRSYLSSNAHGTFLWVALVCRVLANVSGWEAVKSVKKFPAELNPFYQRMIGEIYSSKNAELCGSILAVASIVYRPITLDELPCLVNMPPESCGNDEAITEIIKLCGSFLAIRDDNRTIYFVHQSAKDFLCDCSLNTNSDNMFQGGMERIHYALFSKSLQQLSKPQALRRDMYDLLHLGTLVEDAITPTPDPLAPLKYSCIYWVDHLFDADATESLICTDDQQDECPVYNFLRNKYIYWLEALSLLREVPKGVLAIGRLTSLIQSIAEGSELYHLLRDTHRFIMSHRWIIEHAPLQIYTSALLFTPTKSLTRRFFEEKRPKWIMDKSIEKEEWGMCVSTLEGHTAEVGFIAFSADGKYIVSASSDTTIRVWDVTTATSRVTLGKQSSHISQVNFLPDGRYIAIVLEDGIIKVWRWRWGEDEGAMTTTAIPNEYGDNFYVIILSDDGKYIASETRDNITLWSLDQGVIKMIANTKKSNAITGHNENYIVSFAFSTNANHIVLVLIHNTLNVLTTVGDTMIVTATSNTWRERLSGDISPDLTGYIISSAFSVDRKYIAIATSNHIIGVWDWDWNINARTTKSAICIAKLEGHSDEVYSMVFSTSGKYIASASLDGNVKVWDWGGGGDSTKDTTIVTTNTCKCIVTIEDCCTWRGSVTFSADDGWIASTSFNSTIKIWDLDKGTDATIAITKTATCKCVTILKGHYSTINSIASSSDGKYLASASCDGTIKIWDAITNTYMVTLEGSNCNVRFIAFSADGKYIASASGDGLIRLWNCDRGADPTISYTTLTSYKCVAIIETHENNLDSVIFSTDGRYIASTLDNGNIQLWDWNRGRNLNMGNASTATTATRPHDVTATCKRVATIQRNFEPRNYSTGDPVVFLADGKHIISASSNGMVEIWGYGANKDHDVTTTAENKAILSKGRFVNLREDIQSVALSIDGKTVAFVLKNGSVEVWGWGWDFGVFTTIRDVMTAPEKRRAILKGYSYDGKREMIELVAFSANGKYIASASHNGSINVWNWDVTVKYAKCVATLAGHEQFRFRTEANAIAFSADGNCIFSALSDGSIKVWRWGGDGVAIPIPTIGRIATCTCFARHERHSDMIGSIIFSADGEYIASASKDHTIKVWNWQMTATTMMVKCIATLVGHFHPVQSIFFSIDGKYIASVSDDNDVKIWHTTTAICIATFQERQYSDIDLVTFLADGEFAAVSNASWMKIWHIRTAKCRAKLFAPAVYLRNIYLVAFSADGKYLATAAEDDTVTIWDLDGRPGRYAVFGLYDGDYDSIGEGARKTTSTGHLSHMSFSANGTCLDTDRGCIELELPPSSMKRKYNITSLISTPSIPSVPSVHRDEYGISGDNTWITHNGRNILWLPSGHRPTCHAVYGSVVAIGCSSGLLWLMKFPLEL